MTIRSDNQTALQKALYSRLTLALTEQVYSSPPDAEAYPYVLIGFDGVGEELEASGKLLEHTVNIQVFSEARGTAEVKTISGTILNDLTGSVLDMSGDNFSANRMRHVSTDIDTITDGSGRNVQNSSISFEVMVQDTT